MVPFFLVFFLFFLKSTVTKVDRNGSVGLKTRGVPQSGIPSDGNRNRKVSQKKGVKRGLSLCVPVPIYPHLYVPLSHYVPISMCQAYGRATVRVSYCVRVRDT